MWSSASETITAYFPAFLASRRARQVFGVALFAPHAAQALLPKGLDSESSSVVSLSDLHHDFLNLIAHGPETNRDMIPYCGSENFLSVSFWTALGSQTRGSIISMSLQIGQQQRAISFSTIYMQCSGQSSSYAIFQIVCSCTNIPCPARWQVRLYGRTLPLVWDN